MRTLTISDPAFVGSQRVPPLLSGTLANWWADDLTLAGGDPVSSWVDRANGVTLANTSTARPTFRAAHIGGRPAVDFDGSNDVLSVANTLTSGSSGCVTAVVLIDTATGGRGIWSSADEASGSYYITGACSLSSAAGKAAIEAANGSLLCQVRGDTSLSTATPYLLEWSTSGSTYTFRVNGVTQTLTTIVGSNAGQWFDDISNRDSFGVGALKFNSTATAFFDGAIAHLQVLSTPMSSGDRAVFHAFVSARYGLVL